MNQVRAVAILNPAASSGGAARRRPAIEQALRAQFTDLQISLTERPGHATELCAQALAQGAELVISVGGDGTNNEVLAGFVDERGRNRYPGARLGIVAAGTGGDFQRMFGVLRPERQVARMAQAEPRVIDYGIARFIDHDGRPRLRTFLNVASVGISGLVVRYVVGSSRALGSTAAYVGASLRGIATWRNKPVWLQVDDEPEQRFDLTLLCIGNGQYFGAGMWTCPLAAIDDELFDVTELAAMSAPRIAWTLTKVFKGRHLRVEGVRHYRARRLALRPVHDPAEVLIDLDGEQPGRLPASFELVPRGLRVQVG